eukprot:gene10989-3061_t
MWSKLISKLDHELLDTVVQTGYAVVDDAWDKRAVATLREEIELLHGNGKMDPNQVQFTTSSGPIRLTKPGIFEADMHDRNRRQLCPAFNSLFHSVYEVQKQVKEKFNVAIEQSQQNLALHENRVHNDGTSDQSTGKSGSCESHAEQDITLRKEDVASNILDDDKLKAPTTFTLKLQFNDGTGGCFPYHYDNPAPPNRRLITILVYLNECWSEGDGGELMLLPFLENPVIIPPLANRTVLFRSDMVLHRVLPASNARACFTLWLDGLHTNQNEDVFLREKHLTPEFIPQLKRSPLQRTLSRAVYEKEYEESLRQCFCTNKNDTLYALAMHKAHLNQHSNNQPLKEFVQHLKAARTW